MDKTHFDVRITMEEMRQLLEQELSASPNKKLLAEIIIGNLSLTEVGLEQTFKGMRGINNSLKYKKGDKLWMDANKLYSWRADKAKMIENNMIFQDKVPVEVTKLRPYNSETYQVKYEYMTTSGEKSMEENCTVPEEYLIPKDNFPLDL
jgi:ASC-1-like (ASCH) protein